MIVPQIKTDKKVYCEPFIGSGAILFNLGELHGQFEEFVINDSCRNIIRIYKSFKEIEYSEYLEAVQDIHNKFGWFSSTKSTGLTKDAAKENYYNFRNHFNQNYWKTDTIKEGIHLHVLANSCLNSFLRFGPNGMNQSFGNRELYLEEKEFNNIKEVLNKTRIYNTDYHDVLKEYKDKAFFFFDPPYASQDSSYASFSLEDLRIFLDDIEGTEFLYTDILNNVNEEHAAIKDKKLIREMISTSPNRKVQENGNMEYLFSSSKLTPVNTLLEW